MPQELNQMYHSIDAICGFKNILDVYDKLTFLWIFQFNPILDGFSSVLQEDSENRIISQAKIFDKKQWKLKHTPKLGSNRK